MHQHAHVTEILGDLPCETRRTTGHATCDIVGDTHSPRPQTSPGQEDSACGRDDQQEDSTHGVGSPKNVAHIPRYIVHLLWLCSTQHKEDRHTMLVGLVGEPITECDVATFRHPCCSSAGSSYGTGRTREPRVPFLPNTAAHRIMQQMTLFERNIVHEKRAPVRGKE